MNKKSKEIVKKLCFTLVIVISIITIIGCPNTVSNKANDTSSGGGSTGGGDDPKPDPIKDTIEAMRIKGNNDPIVTNLRGLGFGMKDNKLCLSYGGVNDLEGTPKLLSEAKEDIEKKIGTWNDYPTGDSYSNIKDGLEKRWKATKETVGNKSPGSVKWLSDETAYNGYFSPGEARLTYGHSVSISGLAFAVDVRKGKLFVISGAFAPAYILFADWHIVFVERVEDPNPDKIPEMYSFHYGPYTLKGNFDKDNPKIPRNYNENFHVFTLPEMLKDCLKKEGKEAIADQVVAEFPPLLPKNKNKYDVYLVIGKVFCNDCPIMFRYETVSDSFRNVLKLNDEGFWGRCWNQ